MNNQLQEFFKTNKQWILVTGILGVIFFFISKNLFPKDTLILESSLEGGIIENLGITGDIKMILFFLLLGIIIGLLIKRK